MAKKANVFIDAPAYATEDLVVDCEMCAGHFPVPAFHGVPSLYLPKGREAIELGAICPTCSNMVPKELANTAIEAAEWHEEQAKLYRKAAARMRFTKRLTVKEGDHPLPREVA